MKTNYATSHHATNLRTTSCAMNRCLTEKSCTNLTSAMSYCLDVMSGTTSLTSAMSCCLVYCCSFCLLSSAVNLAGLVNSCFCCSTTGLSTISGSMTSLTNLLLYPLMYEMSSKVRPLLVQTTNETNLMAYCLHGLTIDLNTTSGSLMNLTKK